MRPRPAEPCVELPAFGRPGTGGTAAVVELPGTVMVGRPEADAAGEFVVGRVELAAELAGWFFWSSNWAIAACMLQTDCSLQGGRHRRLLRHRSWSRLMGHLLKHKPRCHCDNNGNTTNAKQ